MIKIPSADGEINQYNLTNRCAGSPRVIYVNGMQTDGRTHAKTAALISLIAERPVWGVYNRTQGFVVDGLQSGLDYVQNAVGRGSRNSLTPDRKVPAREVSKLADRIIARSTVWNKATPSLFRTLMRNIQSRQLIVAHSQGNLVTSNALFVIQSALGSQALKNIRVYSLASPSPGWPLGLRHTNGGGGRQENAFMNDLVALLRPHNAMKKSKEFLSSSSSMKARIVGMMTPDIQNAGDFRTLKGGGVIGLKAHDIQKNMALNFVISIRRDLGLSTNIDPVALLKKSDSQIERLLKP